MLDLDAIEKMVQAVGHDRREGVLLSAEHVAAWYLDDMPALVAELRAAREAISLLRPMVEGTPLPDGHLTLAALAAYDQAVGGDR